MELSQSAVISTEEHQKITALILKSEKMHKCTLELLKNHNSCVVVSITRPAETIIKEAHSKRIPTQHALFVDVTGSKADNVVSVNNPGALTELSITISQALQACPKTERLLIFEGLGMLTLYNPPSTVQKFAQFLFSKLRLWEVQSYLLTDEATDKSILALLKQNADEVVED